MSSAIVRKTVISPASNQCIKTPCYTQNHWQKCSCIRQLSPPIDHVHYTNKNPMPGINHSHFSKTILPWSVRQNWHASKKKGCPDEFTDIIVILRCLDLTHSGGKTKIELNRKRYHYFGVKYIVFKSVLQSDLSDLAIWKCREEGNFFVCAYFVFLLLVLLLYMHAFVWGGKGWVDKGIITQNGV